MNGDGERFCFPSSFADNSLDPTEQALFQLRTRVAHLETALERQVAAQNPGAAAKVVAQFDRPEGTDDG